MYCSSSGMHAQSSVVSYGCSQKSTCMAWVGHLDAWWCAVRGEASGGPEDTVAVVTDRATPTLRHVFSRHAGPGRAAKPSTRRGRTRARLLLAGIGRPGLRRRAVAFAAPSSRRPIGARSA